MPGSASRASALAMKAAKIQFPRVILTPEIFLMPLIAEGKAFVRHFDCLNDPVRRYRADAHARADLRHTLPVTRIYLKGF